MNAFAASLFREAITTKSCTLDDALAFVYLSGLYHGAAGFDEVHERSRRTTRVPAIRS